MASSDLRSVATRSLTRRSSVGERSAVAGRSAKRRSLTRHASVNEASAKQAAEEAKQQCVPASWFHEGTLLDELSKRHVEVFSKLLRPGRHHGVMRGRITWGSLCSGSEGAHFVMEAIHRALNESLSTALGQDSESFQFEQVFACEIDQDKRKWIDFIANTDPSNGVRRPPARQVCIFGDIKEMGHASVYCHTHCKKCPVPDCNVLIVSTSCKDLSPLSSNARNNALGPVLGRTTSPGGTADTFRRGMLVYMDAHPVDVIIYENSDNLDDSDAAGGNFDLFQSEMHSRSFEGQCFVLNSKLFGVPQNRRRFWGVFFATAQTIIDYSERSVSDMVKTLSLLLQTCQSKCPSALDLLLPDDDDMVASELLARIEKEHCCDEAPKWISEHQQVYAELRLQWGVDPPCSATNRSPWLQTLTRSQQSTLVLNQYRLIASQSNQQLPTVSDQKQMPRLMVDVFPSKSRLSTSILDSEVGEIAPCILPNQLLWLHLPSPRTPRLMLAYEAMLFQGWPIAKVQLPTWASAKLLQQLAGNAVSTPVLLAVALSAFMSASWTKPRHKTETTAEDVDHALTLMAQVCPSWPS